MHLTEAALVAIIVSVAPTLAALAGLWATWRMRKVAVERLDHIVVLTNSTLTAANRRIDQLEELVRSLTAAAAVRASRSTRKRSPAGPPAGCSPSVGDSV